MARVIIPDVTPFVQQATAPSRVKHIVPDLFDVETAGKVVDTATKLATNPVVIAGVDAIRRSIAESEMKGAQRDIEDVQGDLASQAELDKRRAAAQAALGAQKPAAATPGPVMAQEAQLEGLTPAQKAAARMVLERARKEGRQITPAFIQTVKVAAASGNLLASGPSPEEYRAEQAQKAEAERRALQQRGEEVSGRYMTNKLLADREREEQRKREADAIEKHRVNRIVMLSEALSKADTIEEVEAIQKALKNLSKEPVEVPNAPTRVEAGAPEVTGGREVYTPGAGQSMATTPEEAAIEKEMIARQQARTAPAPTPAAVRAPAPTREAAPLIRPESYRLREDFSAEALPSVKGPEAERLSEEQRMAIEAAVPEAAAPVPEPGPSQEELVATMKEAVTLRTPAELIAAARSARTLEQQRLILSQIDEVELPSTNIFESLGLLPKDNQRLALAKEISKQFPKTVESDPLVAARIARLEAQSKFDREKGEREERITKKKETELSERAGAAKSLADLREEKKKTEEETRQDRIDKIKSEIKRNDAYAKAALRKADALVRAVETGRLRLDLLGDGEEAKLELEGIKSAGSQLTQLDTSIRALEKGYAANMPEPPPRSGLALMDGTTEWANHSKQVEAYLENKRRGEVLGKLKDQREQLLADLAYKFDQAQEMNLFRKREREWKVRGRKGPRPVRPTPRPTTRPSTTTASSNKKPSTGLSSTMSQLDSISAQFNNPTSGTDVWGGE